jgi:hypothetical protein
MVYLNTGRSAARDCCAADAASVVFAGNRGLSAGAFSISLPSGVRADYGRRCVDVPSASVLAAETSAFSNA